MNPIIFLPFLLSLAIGYLLLNILLYRGYKINLGVQIFLAGGLGLAVSAVTIFLSLILFNQLHPNLIILANFLLLLTLLILNFANANQKKSLLQSLNPDFAILKDCFAVAKSVRRTATSQFHLKILRKIGASGVNPAIGGRRQILPSCSRAKFGLKVYRFADPWLLIGLIIILIPAWIHAHFYPQGGWDAWAVWNLKAKTILLADTDWQRIFDPLLWRSSPHYPLLLPLINVWGWILAGQPLNDVPLFTSIFFIFLLAGLLLMSLKSFTKSSWSFLSAAVLLSSSFFLMLTISQYCDIVLSYYLLATLICLLISRQNNSSHFALVAGLMNGFLSFTKPEGLIASLILCFISIPYFFFQNKTPANKAILTAFFKGCLIGMIPTIIFSIFYRPPSLTFINGLASMENPSDPQRLKFILAFYGAELISKKWNGIWIILLGGIILSRGKCFQKRLAVIPAFLFIYNCVVMAYYYTNTYFEIGWWLQNTLNRILFALLPVAILWVFLSLWPESREQK